MVTSFARSKCQFVKGETKATVAIILLSLLALTLHLPTAEAAPPNVAHAKIVWEDFASFYPSQLFVLGRALMAQTPMSFVVETQCALKKLKLLRPGEMLNSVLVQGARAVTMGEEFTVGIELKSSLDFELIESEIAKENCIKSVGYDGEISLSQVKITKTDPIQLRQTHLAYIRFEQGQKILQPYLMIRKPVVIAVIDAGVELTHPDLAQGIWRNTKEVPGNGRDDDGNGFVDDLNGYNFGSEMANPHPQLDGIEGAHGTHVAGLAAARWRNGAGGVGIGGIAKIMAINVFGTRRSVRSSVVENAIRYAARNGADVINLSLSGGEYSRTMEAALRYAVSKGAFIVSAAGNEGLKFETSPALGVFFSPAAYGMKILGMVSVASLDAQTGTLSRFSNFNSSIIQVAAPGAISSYGEVEGLLSSFPNGRYGQLAGTSMAVPLVSGAAALVYGYLKACGLNHSPSRVEALLVNGSSVNSKLGAYVNNGRELDIDSLAQRLRALGCR